MANNGLIPFNGWSREQIIMGNKVMTSRHKRYKDDPLVSYITPKLEWGFIRRFLWEYEGAESPDELQEVIEEIYNRKVEDDERFHVHVFDNLSMSQRLINKKSEQSKEDG